MAAQYPGSTKTFAPKVDGGVQIIMANDINEITDEVTAVEADLRAGLPIARGGTGATTAAGARANLDVLSDGETNQAIQNSTFDASAIISGIFNALRIPALNLISGVLNRVQQAVGTAYQDINNLWSTTQSFLGAVVISHPDTPIIYLVRGGVYDGELLLSGGNMYLDNNGTLVLRTMAGAWKMNLTAAGALTVHGTITAESHLYGASINAGSGYINGPITVVGVTSLGSLSAGEINSSGSLRVAGIVYEQGFTTAMGIWKDYTPSFTTLNIGNGSVQGSYSRIGNTIHFRICIILGTTSSIGGAAFTFTWPVPCWIEAASSAVVFGSCHHVSTGGFQDLAGQAENANTCYVRVLTGGSVMYVTATTPWAWASNDRIFLHGTYRAG